MPALLCTASIRPHLSRTVPIAARTAPPSDTSAWRAMLPPPTSDAVRCAASRLRSRITTVASCRAYARAHSRPMPSAPPVNTTTFPERSAGISDTLFPIVMSRLCEPFHGLFHILLCEFAFPLAQQVDDPLMRFQISIPCRGPLPACGHTHAYKGEERQQNSPRVRNDVWIARQFAEFEMKE